MNVVFPASAHRALAGLASPALLKDLGGTLTRNTQEIRIDQTNLWTKSSIIIKLVIFGRGT